MKQITLKLPIVILVALQVVACASLSKKSDSTSSADSKIASSQSAEESLNQTIHGVSLDNKNFDMPVVYNPDVEKWIDFFTGRGREHFEIYLSRMSDMAPVIIPRLEKAGVPTDLIHLCMIESGFSTRAKSHAGAVGPWQFIRSTGRIYDLRIDAWRDERRDPAKATDAAIAYLTSLYNEFGDWGLAAAAYNSGEIRIRNAIKKYNTKNFFELAHHRGALRRETRDYVPKMMAAAIIAKNAEQFGFKKPEWTGAWTEAEHVKFEKPADLRAIAKLADLDQGLVKEMNPELLQSCTPPVENGYDLRLPKDNASKLRDAIAAGNVDLTEGFRRHTVKKGESLSGIARRFGTHKDIILAMNEINPSAMRVGMELLIPGPSLEFAPQREPQRIAASHGRRHRRHRHSSEEAQAEENIVTAKGQMVYVVQKGDTLYDISRKYSVTVDKIKDWNSISRSKALQPGRRLKLYVRNEQT